MKTETYEVLKQLPLRKENGEPWQPGERIQLAARAAKYLLLSGHLAAPDAPKTKTKKTPVETEIKD
ncbi:conserved protein [Tepidicaulis marinus]|uniref:Conserved protein n=1 Tax=Tepidicaulis marinus TaxID=1333998 RepID=A0A081B6D3_9HYPH|nr:hypothetical protein [Tepidicaulis marinus]GAK43601.1 conserved protein [Tepidicaulis marinus]